MITKVRDFWHEFDENFCREYILKYQSSQYRDIKNSVNQLMEQIFVFDDNWDMEPCIKPYYLPELQWDIPVTDDLEWNYMLNRQQYLLKFLVVYLVEKDAIYCKKLKYYIFHWISCHYELRSDALISRPLDTGIRCFTWLKIILFLKHFNEIDTHELKIIEESIKEQLIFLKENYLEKYSLSNWGIFQTTAILACLYHFQWEEELPELKAFAFSELLEQLRLQVLEDGSQYEQSILYHVEVYRTLLELAILVPKYKHILNPTLEKMVHYLEMMTGPDHKQVAFGDSDVTDTRDILTLSALFFESSDLKAVAFRELDITSLMYFGRKGVERYQKLLTNNELERTELFSSSGHVCSKGYERYLFFKCGPLGSAHSHSDLNSICLYDKGKPIFIDPGRYTYREDDLRYWFKSARAHSTCFIRDIQSEIIKDSWTYDSYPEVDHLSLSGDNNLFLAEGAYTVDSTSLNVCRFWRYLVGLPHRITLIFDKIICPGTHELETQFILDEKVVVDNQRLNDLQLISKVPFNRKEIIVSKKYNQLSQSQCVFKRQSFKDKIYDGTLLVDKEAVVKRHPLIQTGSKKILEDGFAWEIRGQNYHYLIAILLSDILKGDKLYEIKGYKCRGKIVVYDFITKSFYRLKS